METISCILARPEATGLIGLVIGAVITYFFSSKIVKKQEYYKAASLFRSAFTREVMLFEKESDDPYKIIEPAIENHYKALIQFRPYLNSKDMSAIQKAWNDYATNSEQYFSGGEINKKKEQTALVRQRIDKLLSFASPKK